MKKSVLIFMIVILFLVGTFFLKGESKKGDQGEYIQKTYFLKNISAEFAFDSLKIYILNHSTSGNILSVTVRRDNVEQFEKLLEKIDVEKKKINFRIFTVIGFHEDQKERIENNDLKKVLAELKKVLSFKSFKVDGVSSLATMDGAKHSKIKLSSKSGLNLGLELFNIVIKNEKPEGRSVHFRFTLFTYMESTSFIKENGYLVAGVSEIGKNGDSLILIMNAEIE